MEQPKVSVIIPVYNGAKTLRGCLSSVLNQTYKNYEVIVVDNNSTDETKDIIEEFCNKNDKIKYLFESKRGAGAARYKGEINSNSDIILMTDSDCIIPENWIDEMIEPIAKNNEIAVQGIKKAAIINYWTRQTEQEKERQAIEKNKNKKVGLVDTANFAIKKSVLQDVGYSNPNLPIGHDLELEVKLKIKGYNIYFKRVEALHYYPDTALKVFKKRLCYGVWYGVLRKMYKTHKELFDIRNIRFQLDYFIAICLEMLCLDENFKYDLITGMAWRIGFVYGYVWKRKPPLIYPNYPGMVLK